MPETKQRSIRFDEYVWDYVESVRESNKIPSYTKALEYIVLEHKIIKNNGIMISVNGGFTQVEPAPTVAVDYEKAIEAGVEEIPDVAEDEFEF